MVDVKVCIGTYSYIMGGSDLVNMDSHFPEHWKGRVKLSGAVSLEGCDEAKMNPPFASVNNNLITEANEEKIRRAVEKELNNQSE